MAPYSTFVNASIRSVNSDRRGCYVELLICEIMFVHPRIGRDRTFMEPPGAVKRPQKYSQHIRA